MKAYDMMMYMLTLNLIIFMFGVIGIFNFGFSGLNFTEAIIKIAAWGGVGAAIGTIAGAAIIGFFTRTEMSTTYWAITIFSAVFWGTFSLSLGIFDSISSTLMSFGVAKFFMYTIYIVISSFVFLFGVIQMIVGGAKSYK